MILCRPYIVFDVFLIFAFFVFFSLWGSEGKMVGFPDTCTIRARLHGKFFFNINRRLPLYNENFSLLQTLLDDVRRTSLWRGIRSNHSRGGSRRRRTSAHRRFVAFYTPFYIKIDSTWLFWHNRLINDLSRFRHCFMWLSAIKSAKKNRIEGLSLFTHHSI